MAEIVTPWGYSVTVDDPADGEAATMPPLLSTSEFRSLTGNRLSSTDEVVAARLAAASSVVRDWCGWHVAPALPCSCELDGGGRTMFLPCMGVRSVESVAVRGEDWADSCEWASRGELRLPRRTPPILRLVAVSFTAGYDAAGAQALAQVVCQVVENALVATPGLREEHAGNVGATYNQTENGVSGGVRLLASDLAALAPYRIVTA